jgi:Domain of unknown function (DUF4124)
MPPSFAARPRSAPFPAESHCALAHLAATAAALLLALALSTPAAAALYKWTDANGRVVYSDQPPPGGTKMEIIAAPAPPANPAAVKEMATKDAEFKKRQIEQSDVVQKEEKLRAESGRLAEVCLRARGQAAQLGQEQVVLYRINAQGEQVAMDAETRRRERANVEKWLKDNKCPPAQTGP